MVKFFSRNQYLYIGYRQVPGYPLFNRTVKDNSGVQFVKGVFETNDAMLITGLRNLIPLLNGHVWEDGHEPTMEEPIALEIPDDEPIKTTHEVQEIITHLLSM